MPSLLNLNGTNSKRLSGVGHSKLELFASDVYDGLRLRALADSPASNRAYSFWMT
jgi:hypothetical protein